MNGNSFVVDTNILLQLINEDDTLASLLDNKKLIISFITELELLSYEFITQRGRTDIEHLISDCTIVDINQPIKKISVDFRIKFRLKLPDAIIAATAAFLKIPLITSDGDFNKIDSLHIYFYQK